VSDVLNRCARTFGTSPPQGLFYHFDHALRFELAGDLEGAVPRFLKAYDRANVIASSLFADQPDPVCLLSYFSETEAPERAHFPEELLQPLAIDSASIIHLGGSFSADDEMFRQWVQIDPPPVTGVVLWSAIGADLGIGPNLPGWLYLVDFERRLIVHPYDDRGMDVIAMDRETLLPLYREFGGWLLGYDRNRMDDVFGSKV